MLYLCVQIIQPYCMRSIYPPLHDPLKSSSILLSSHYWILGFLTLLKIISSHPPTHSYTTLFDSLFSFRSICDIKDCILYSTPYRYPLKLASTEFQVTRVSWQLNSYHASKYISAAPFVTSLIISSSRKLFFSNHFHLFGNHIHPTNTSANYIPLNSN